MLLAARLDQHETTGMTATAEAENVLEEASTGAPRLSDIMEESTEESTENQGMVYSVIEASMMLSSIQRDLTIKIVGPDGKRLTGRRWVAYVYHSEDNKFIYEDVDHDGMIYIPEIKAGNYEVMLGEMVGVRVPDRPTGVSIKDNIVYRAIPDIRDKIKTESEIDVALEDTADIEEVDEGVTYATGRVGTLGIDVSKWNKEIDWQQVRDFGVDYAIIRLGYRGSSSGALVEDPYFEQNFRNADASNVKKGVYFFTQAMTEAEAVEEASMVVSVLAGASLDYPVFLDVEGSGGRADVLDNSQRTANIKAFCETIENAGYRAGVYANKNWFTNRIQTEELADYVIWLAQYNVPVPTYEGDYHIWQYSSKGAIPGIAGYVDMNQCYDTENP